MALESTQFNILVVTLTNVKQIIDIGSNTNRIDSQIDKIKSAFGCSDKDIILMYAGKILDITKTFADYGIMPNNQIIMMKKSIKKKEEQVSQPSSGNIPIPPRPQQTQHVEQAFAPNIPTQNTQVQQVVSDIQQFWSEQPSQEDNLPNYSIHQIHAVLPFFVNYILANPQVIATVLINPTAIGNQLASRQYRQVIREFFAQSSTIIGGLRGANPQIQIRVTLPMNQQNQYQNQQEHDIENEEYTDDDTGADQPEETSRASREIKELADMTGISEEEVRRIYNICGGDITLTANMLLGNG